MKSYDSIEYYGDYWGVHTIAFDKLDGSNLRFEYSQKRGFYKFGTRNVMIDASNPDFGFAIDIFLNKYNESLCKLFKEKDYRNIQSFVCFAELLGKNSAFGQHDLNDNFDIVLFDVNEYKKGFVPPRRFIKDFGDLGIPKVVYEGNLNKEFVQRVKTNEFGLSEGVICKSAIKTKKLNDQLYYCKIKTNDWFDRLRNKNIEMYNKEVKELKEQ